MSPFKLGTIVIASDVRLRWSNQLELVLLIDFFVSSQDVVWMMETSEA